MKSDPIQKTELLSGPTLRRPPHALPFRAIFQEYESRRRADLVNSVGKSLNLSGLSDDEILRALEGALSQSDKAYAALEDAKQRLADTDSEQSACALADVPLKKILHCLEGTALCLS